MPARLTTVAVEAVEAVEAVDAGEPELCCVGAPGVTTGGVVGIGVPLSVGATQVGPSVGSVVPLPANRRQRTRWMKGFVQTCVTHSRQPVVAMRQLGFVRFWSAVAS